MAGVPDSIDFPKEEEQILKFWKDIDAFQTSLKMSKGRPRYTFYDGPPFATGTPHYGHLLAGTIKDVVTRWAHQSGFHVQRRFGWDCHGLPIEYEIDKQLNISGPNDVLKMGVDKYNDECRKIVMRYSEEWRFTVTRFGRWIDFDNDYKTMYPWFMESIWWAFKQLYNKGLVYRGVKVMPYSTTCSTPLSNFESGQNYKEVLDPAVVVSFPLVNDKNVSFIAWTTTPWTLPSNLALCVHPELEYCKVRETADSGRVLIMMKARLSQLFKDEKEYELLETFPGKKLEGLSYQPLFPYFEHLKEKGAFKILCDTYVSTDAGTGVVHQAPYFGEDDNRVCLKYGVITKEMAPICPVDASGCFTAEVSDFFGMYVKDADKEICKLLKQNGRMVQHSQVKHSYPFCWRSDTPLIYRAVPSWFVRVENYSDQLLKNNDITYWVPEFIKQGRFANWLKEARDWAISRNRFWGNPIPIWMSDDGEEIVCVGSIEELKELTGFKGEITDLHKEFVDQLTIPSKRGKGQLRRIPEVFDCWFESGSMPYAQQHFPFENSREFLDGFPADFIAEGVDQTRGWFYTLTVLSTLLFDKPPYKNLIANGLVLAEDGKKMSKRLKNYPEPISVANKYGADAIRLYLVNSPAVRADNLKFKEDGVKAVVRDVFIPWFNAFRFLLQNIERAEKETIEEFTFSVDYQKAPSKNYMDLWILSYTQSLVKFVHSEMAAYRLYTVMPRLVLFIEQLTNWYVRMNRRRLKGENGNEECAASLRTLFSVVLTTCRLLAPFLPFLTEYMYQHLKKRLPEDDGTNSVDGVAQNASVHFLSLPQAVPGLIDGNVETAVQRLQAVVELGRVIRDRMKLSLRLPLAEVVVAANTQTEVDDILSMKQYIMEELNVRKLTATTDRHAYGIKLRVMPDLKILGTRLKTKMKQVKDYMEKMGEKEATEFQKTGCTTICGEKIMRDDVLFLYSVEQTDSKTNSQAKYETHSDGQFFVLLDVKPDESMQNEGLAREFINRVQRLRKDAQLIPTDDVTVYYDISNCSPNFQTILGDFQELIFSTIKQPLKPCPLPIGEVEIISGSFEIKDDKFNLTLTQRGSDWENKENKRAGPKQLKSNVNVIPASSHCYVHREDGKAAVIFLENPVGQSNINSYKDFTRAAVRALDAILEPLNFYIIDATNVPQKLTEDNFNAFKSVLPQAANVFASFSQPTVEMMNKAVILPDCSFVNISYTGREATVAIPNGISAQETSNILSLMASTLLGLPKEKKINVTAKPGNITISSGLAGVMSFLASSKDPDTRFHLE